VESYNSPEIKQPWTALRFSCFDLPKAAVLPKYEGFTLRIIRY